MQSGTRAFKPKARLIQILGEHLIKDATVGIVELVKNSYDADATLVEIVMTKLNTLDALITIRDNGTGMDLDTFLNKWMNPATGHKEEQKEKQIRSKKGRLPLGEKGVGRFAAQQIGDNLRMITKVKDSESELVVSINWKLFGEAEKNLEDIEIKYEEREPNSFGIKESGTLLQITNFRNKITESDIKKISNALKRMKSPFKGVKDFEVTLKFIECPDEFYKHEGLEVSDIIDKAHYSLIGIIDANGILDFEYKFNVPGEKQNTKNNKIDLIKEYGLDIRKPTVCGSFLINLYNYDKSPDWIQKANIAKGDLEDLCGVNVYRDGIRILPYGERGDDWLKLDNRRIQNTKSIGNDTIIGLAEINQTENRWLIDKTNREGLRENSAFEQFRSLVFSTVRVLEDMRSYDRPQKAKKEKKKDDELKEEVENIKQQLSELAKLVSRSSDEQISQKAPVIEEVGNKVENIEKQYQERQDDYNKRNETLFNLAGTGLAAERFTHEFARLIDGASRAFVRLQSQIDIKEPKIKREMEIIKQALEALRNDIRLLGPMFYVKRVAKEKELSIKQIIDSTINLQQHSIQKEKIDIEFSGNNFSVIMSEGACMQVFNNIIDNSVFWLSRKTETDQKKIKFIMDEKNKTVYVSDSGPGIPERNKDRIFEPFISTKGEEGRGLGLYIVKEILEEKKWNIFIVNKEDFKGLLNGASFKIIFTENN